MKAAKPRTLAVVPARGGSTGLPGKNIRPFAGLPLIAHSIQFAKLCPEIDRVVVSTDSEDIAHVARRFGGEVPFLRPAELARHETPIWPVLRHALRMIEEEERRAYDFLLLLDPTSPAREQTDVRDAYTRLVGEVDADGVVAVSRPTFNPIWHCVVEKDGWMSDLFESAARYQRRQDVPPVYRINGALYLWRTEFVRRVEGGDWRSGGRHIMVEIPEIRAMSIDTLEQFQQAEVLVTTGVLKLSWLDAPGVA
jgi:N-acylneuraminate cytidylyltransferase